MEQNLKTGQEVRVQVGDKILSGVVKFVNSHFVSVDEGNSIFALLKFNANTNAWEMGGRPVTIFQVNPPATPMLDRLNKMIEVLDSVLTGKRL